MNMNMDMTPQCKMNMLWNTAVINTCIVFRGWRISSGGVFAVSCLAIIALSVVYEYLRILQRALDVSIARRLSASMGKDAGLLGALSATLPRVTPVPVAARAARALLYGVTVFLSFFLMLVFMTYNAYLIMSVVIGAILGNYIFRSTMNVESILQYSPSGSAQGCH